MAWWQKQTDRQTDKQGRSSLLALVRESYIRVDFGRCSSFKSHNTSQLDDDILHPKRPASIRSLFQNGDGFDEQLESPGTALPVSRSSACIAHGGRPCETCESLFVLHGKRKIKTEHMKGHALRYISNEDRSGESSQRADLGAKLAWRHWRVAGGETMLAMKEHNMNRQHHFPSLDDPN
eukprot:scaffold1954_cov268-Pinguiococcus_pyrenoidosus.AAC.212